MSKPPTISDKHAAEQSTVRLDFEDNNLLPGLFGHHNRNLTEIEQQLGVEIHDRGNQLLIKGPASATEAASHVLQTLYTSLQQGEAVEVADVKAALRLFNHTTTEHPSQHAFPYKDEASSIATRLRRIHPRTPRQVEFVQVLRQSPLVFALGPAGTGKTYMAVAMAVSMLQDGLIERIILSRPVVEAGERLGFLPGDIREKVDPYFRPIYDALFEMLPTGHMEKMMETGQIEIAPLAYMRGRTLSNAFVLVDEAQNTTPVQMRMLLTRLGEHSRMVVTGDLSQKDLPYGQESGLAEAVKTLANVEEISFINFTDEDVVRHPLVSKIIRAYAASDKSGGSAS